MIAKPNRIVSGIAVFGHECCGLPNLWVYRTEMFWEFYLVMSAEELPNQNCFGICSVFFLCVMVHLLRLFNSGGEKLTGSSLKGV